MSDNDLPVMPGQVKNVGWIDFFFIFKGYVYSKMYVYLMALWKVRFEIKGVILSKCSLLLLFLL